MKKIIIFVGIALTLSSCNYFNRITDSEIDAIRDQTKVLEQQNVLIDQQNKALLEILKSR